MNKNAAIMASPIVAFWNQRRALVKFSMNPPCLWLRHNHRVGWLSNVLCFVPQTKSAALSAGGWQQRNTSENMLCVFVCVIYPKCNLYYRAQQTSQSAFFFFFSSPDARSEDQLCMCVRNGGRPEVEWITGDTPTEMVELMERCWQQNPQKRPTFQGMWVWVF